LQKVKKKKVRTESAPIGCRGASQQGGHKGSQKRGNPRKVSHASGDRPLLGRGSVREKKKTQVERPGALKKEPGNQRAYRESMERWDKGTHPTTWGKLG